MNSGYSIKDLSMIHCRNVEYVPLYLTLSEIFKSSKIQLTIIFMMLVMVLGIELPLHEMRPLDRKLYIQRSFISLYAIWYAHLNIITSHFDRPFLQRNTSFWIMKKGHSLLTWFYRRTKYLGKNSFSLKSYFRIRMVFLVLLLVWRLNTDDVCLWHITIQAIYSESLKLKDAPIDSTHFLSEKSVLSCLKFIYVTFFACVKWTFILYFLYFSQIAA